MENNNINLKKIKEENNMRISMFKGGRILKFVQGVLEKVRDNNKIDGEFEFYQLSKEKINKIAELKKSMKDDDELLYNIIPIIGSFEMDVTLKEFKEMLQFPTKQFMEVINQVLEITKEMLDTSNTMANLKNKVDDLNNNPMVKGLKEEAKDEIVQEPVKTKEEILDELYSQLSTPEIKSDKDKRMAILSKINKLESNEKSA